jgi:hypothetical protein
LKRLAPLQNGGTAAMRIARVCRDLVGEGNDAAALRARMRVIDGAPSSARAVNE